jgi:hypothetical protein
MGVTNILSFDDAGNLFVFFNLDSSCEFSFSLAGSFQTELE